MKNLQKNITMTLLVVIYLLSSTRYFPGRFLKSISETLLHMLTVAPFTIGATILIIALLRKISTWQPTIEITIRIFLTISIIIEFFLGFAHYVGQAEMGFIR